MKMSTSDGSFGDFMGINENRRPDSTGQGQKLAQYFYKNTDGNDNDTQLHCGSTPLIPFSSKESELASSTQLSLPHYQLSDEQIEQDTKMLEPLTDTTAHLMLSNSQSLNENPTDTTNSPLPQDTQILVLELVSSYLHTIAAHDQSNVEQIKSDPIFSNIQSHIDKPTDAEDSSGPCKTQLNESSVQDLLSASLNTHWESNCKFPNSSVNDNNNTKGSIGELQHICHENNCGKLFDNSKGLKRHLAWHCVKKNFFCAHCNKGYKNKGQLIVHIKRHSNYKKTKCQGPNFRVDGDNKIKDSNGDLQPDFGKVFHNTRFARKDSANERVKKIHKRDNRYLPMSSKSDLQVSQEFSFPLTPLLRKMTISPDLPPLTCNEDGSTDTISASQGVSDSQVLIPSSTSETSTSLPTLVGNKNCLDDPVNTASASIHTSDNQSSVQNSLPTRQLVLPSKNTPKQNSSSILEPEKPKKAVRQSECRCPYCSFIGGNKTIGSNGKPQHICHFPECRKIYSRPSALYRHLRLHSGKKNFFCAHCNKAFARKDSLEVHIAIHMTDNRNKGRWAKCQCANCIKGGKKEECFEKKWQHVCSYCGKVYKQLGNLKIHLLEHVGEKKFICAHCNKGYARKDKLGWHMKIHMNKGRKWARCSCPYCSADSDLKIRTPGGKPLHICHIPGCKNVYSDSWRLKRHLESHSGKENYFCPNCNKGFIRQDSFDRHVKNHTNVKRKKANDRPKQVCNVFDCGRVFNSFTSLKNHLKSHNEKNDSEGFAGKGKLREQDRRLTNTNRNEPKNINDSQITENEQTTLMSNQISVQDNLDGPQLACNIDGCGEIYNSIRLLSAHLKYYHNI